MTTEIRTRAQRRDRWVSWIVIAIFVIALACGWLVKTLAESRTVQFEMDGLRAHYPADWVRTDAEEPYLLRVEDPLAYPFRTALTLQRRPFQGALGTVKSTLALERARNWGECTAYRVLETEESVSIYGRTAMHVTFAYVETNVKPGFETEPVVMVGEDYIFYAENQVYIVTITAAEENSDRAHDVLQGLMSSLQVP